MIGGAIYGASHTLSGHSLDNLKTRLQLDPDYRGMSTVGAAKKLWGMFMDPHSSALCVLSSNIFDISLLYYVNITQQPSVVSMVFSKG